MLDLKEINEEIAKLEAGKTCYPNCERLAWLYIVRDHLKGTGRSAHTAMAVWDNEPHAVNRETADKWASILINEDGTRGPHWSYDQVKQLMAQKGVSHEPNEFYSVLNAIYADYCKVFKKYGVGGNMDFYVDMAKAWLDDKDAGTGKAAAYYEHIAKH